MKMINIFASKENPESEKGKKRSQRRDIKVEKRGKRGNPTHGEMGVNRFQNESSDYNLGEGLEKHKYKFR